MSSLGGIFDVIIGMSFVYLLLSMVCSGVNELLAWARGLRSRTLADGIGTLLHDPEVQGLGAKVYDHPLIKGLTPGLPSYLPSSTFVLALLDTLRRENDAQQPIDTLPGIKAALAALPEGSNVRRQLELFADETVTEAAAYRHRLETWFDDSMERVSGVYKRRAQRISMWIGVLLALGAGVDSGVLADALLHEGALREATVAAATDYVQRAARQAPEAPSEKGATAAIAKSVSQLDALALPIGLPYLYERSRAEGAPSSKAQYWLFRLLGIVFTGLAVALGSPFWFDVLSRLINLRISGDPPLTSKERQRTKGG